MPNVEELVGADTPFEDVGNSHFSGVNGYLKRIVNVLSQVRISFGQGRKTT